MTVDTVALNGVRALRGAVTWSHVRWCWSRQRTCVVQGLRLWAGLGVLSRAGCSMLRWGLVARRGAGRLGLMDRPRVMGERLWRIDALLRALRPVSLRRELRTSRWTKGLGMGPATLADHPGSTLQHGVHGLSGVGCHGLDDLLLAVLLRAVLKVGLRVGGRHQRGSSCRCSGLQHL